MLDQEIKAYEKLLPTLKEHHNNKWVVFHGEEFVGAFDSLENAAEEAVRRFGRGPYLIRQVGAPPAAPPVSVMYRPTYAPN